MGDVNESERKFQNMQKAAHKKTARMPCWRGYNNSIHMKVIIIITIINLSYGYI